ncbi:hypothetical protein NEF87_002677 [Candidatus Lokiarchaeum ossiferum]|uniref:TNase-like domain-containing protein n=1 Tax=Candidatus Lokiarchaeum ossiferum TaxID=2951803 RepID=A0ABY6HU49_9ARCH|nr:hypothetical protein NEF87_002677 [Candidatus Lokiarchaeum sp. B-35]
MTSSISKKYPTSNIYRKKVAAIVDGDTFIITGNKYVRIANINTPEKGESGYFKAKRILSSLIPVGSLVTIKQVAIDTYGRIVAYVKYYGRDITDIMQKYGY